MPRKTAGTLQEQRDKIKKQYRRGRKVRKEVIAFDSLTEVEQATKREAACFLKAADYSYTYIGEALGTTRGTVKSWFEDSKMRERVAEIQNDFVDGAVKLLRTYAVELIEMLVEIARTSHDDKIAIQAITEALDRMGLSKVNKSQSAVVQTSRTELDIIDKTGLMEAMKDAPPEVQQEMARKLEEAMALAAEHTTKDVTHA